MKLFSLKSFVVLVVALFSLNPSHAQLTVADTLIANDLAQYFIGLNLTISNVVLNCPSGASGTFDGTNSNIGIDKGIALTSGSLSSVVGPNVQNGTSTNNGAPGDSDLDALIAFGSNDACVLEFDLIPNSTVLYFRYVFGSEEYPEYVSSSFNDVFGFFVSGPGITGVQNIALIPGTTQPVSINSVNNGTTNCPAGPQGPCTNCTYYVDNCGGATVEYDGFTTVLTSTLSGLIPTGTYHLKLAVADVGDFILDSGVFLEAATNDTALISCKPPRNIQSNMIHSTKVELAWDPAAGATKYLVRGNKVGLPGFVFEEVATGVNSMTIEGLGYNTNYFWQVQSICEPNLEFPISPFTQSNTFTTGGVCIRPTNLFVNNLQSDQALLNWSAVPGATSYVVRGKAVGSGNPVTLDGITNNFLAVSNLQPGKSYVWVVKAVCTGPNSSSAFSPINTFTTPSPSAKLEVEALSKSSFISIYPNPATSQLKIVGHQLELIDQVSVHIYNLDGRLIFQDDIQEPSTSNDLIIPQYLSGGIYNILITAGVQTHQERLVLIR